MAKGVLYDKEKVDAIKQTMSVLPERAKPQFNTREVVEHLRDELLAKKQQGYSYRDLADFLNQQGIKISVNTLTGYLQSSPKRKATHRKKKPSLTRVEKTDQKDAGTDNQANSATAPIPLVFAHRKLRHAGFNEDV